MPFCSLFIRLCHYNVTVLFKNASLVIYADLCNNIVIIIASKIS